MQQMHMTRTILYDRDSQSYVPPDTASSILGLTKEEKKKILLQKRIPICLSVCCISVHHQCDYVFIILKTSDTLHCTKVQKLRFSYNNVIIIVVTVAVNIRNNFVMGEKFTFINEKLLVALHCLGPIKTKPHKSSLHWNNSIKSYLHFPQSKKPTMHLQSNRSPGCSSCPTATLFTYLLTYPPPHQVPPNPILSPLFNTAK